MTNTDPDKRYPKCPEFVRHYDAHKERGGYWEVRTAPLRLIALLGGRERATFPLSVTRDGSKMGRALNA